MSGTYKIQITGIIDYATGEFGVIFTGSFIVDIAQLPNIIAFYEDGNPNNILAPAGSWVNSDNAFVSKSYGFSPEGVSITTMSFYRNNYGENTTDNTFNIFSEFVPQLAPALGISYLNLRNYPYDGLTIRIIEGADYQPFPRDTSIPPPCFYNMQGLSMYLNQNREYKIYYADTGLFKYLSVFADNTYPEATDTYNLENVPLPPLLANMSQGQIREYEAQLALFRKVYEYNYNAYLTYKSQPAGSTAGPRYYTFATYKELNNYKAGLQLVNRLYPFDVMGNAQDFLTGVPLRWIVPFPL
jgi:hypothetical protein